MWKKGRATGCQPWLKKNYLYIKTACFVAVDGLRGIFMNTKMERTPCEVYSRVVGYIRPITQWNKGKRAEYADRKEFNKQLAE
jgi:ribonucleoside-triphosphate reductase